MTAREGRFATAAPHYLAGRPPYAPRLFTLMAGRLGLDGSGTLLDLGCGPAPIAIALAPHMGRTIAMDPELAMLAAARAAIAAAAAAVELVAGSSAELDAQQAPLRLVTMGRSFQWMDRPATLAALDRLVVPGGALALLTTRQLPLADHAWQEAFEAALAPFADQDSAGLPHRQPGWLPHEAVLLDSPFARLERIGVIERRTTTLDRLVERAFSQSRTAPAVLGARQPLAEAALRRALAPFVRDGALCEVVESEALLAFREA